MIDTDLEGVVLVLVGGSRGDRDDRNIFQTCVGADVPCQIESIETWHFDIDQHHIEIMSINCSSASTPSLAIST